MPRKRCAEIALPCDVKYSADYFQTFLSMSSTFCTFLAFTELSVHLSPKMALPPPTSLRSYHPSTPKEILHELTKGNKLLSDIKFQPPSGKFSPIFSL